jgi:putative SOS response-associated peptidase YedK
LRDEGLLLSLLQPAPDELLELVQVSSLVNNANNEGPALLGSDDLAPVAESDLTLFG